MELSKIENFLEYYYKKYKTPFRVQTFRKEPRKWINYRGEDCKDDDWVYYSNANQAPNHREVLPAEIVLDIDYHVKDVSKEKEKQALSITLEAIKEKLEELKLTYSLWNSGGNGYHFHLFFDDLRLFNKFDRENLKHSIVKKIAYGYLTHHEDRAHVDLPHMIQVENRFSRKHKKKTLISFVNNGKNEIPDGALIKFTVDKELEKYRPPRILTNNGETPNSIKFFQSNDFQSKDGKKRALFVLASWYKEEGYTPNLVYQKLYEWNEYTLRGYLSRIQINSTVNTVFKSRKRVTSRYRNDLLKSIGATDFLDT